MLPNKFLFHGPKGCGKSKFARATFGELSKVVPEWFTAEVKKENLLEAPLDNVKKTFSAVAQYQINGILIEDIDTLLSDLSNFVAAKRALIEGIKQLKERQVLIATTRHPRKIDDDVLAVFDAIIPFYYPDENDRRDILKVHSQVVLRVDLADDVNLDYVAKKTSWFSGADLENIIVYASRISDGQKIHRKSIDEAISFISNGISISKRIQEMQDIVDFTIQHCTINSVKEQLLEYAAALKIIQAKSESGSSLWDFHKILELKPNICGLGININEIIEALRNRLK